MGQGQLTVKGSSNRMLPVFQEPIFKHLFRGTFYRQLPLIPTICPLKISPEEAKFYHVAPKFWTGSKKLGPNRTKSQVFYRFD